MDLDMPVVQRKAWESLKKAVDDYATLTSNEVAIVTSYAPSSNNQAVDNAPLVTEKSLAIHGHGDLLRRVQESLDRSKLVPGLRAGETVNGWDTQAMSNNIPIVPIEQGSEQSHHNQAVARSLSSSFRSLKLDQIGITGYGLVKQNNLSKTGPGEGYASALGSGRQLSNKHTSAKKSSRPMNIDKGDFELDENLLFDEPSYRMSADENEEYDEFRDSDDSTDLSENSFGRPSNFPLASHVVHSATSVQANPNQYATSLPVTINITWGAKPEGAPRFRDNQGPHPPLQYQQNANHPSKQPTVVRPSHRTVKDTPDPETMMASIQALARSVNNDSAMIFGERPRPRLNTGESRMTRPKR